MNNQEPNFATLAETENFAAYTSAEPDGETIYNLQLNNVTVHFFKEEWDEFLTLARELVKAKK